MPIGGPRDPAPPGWLERARTAEMAVFENPRALPRAFVPRTLRREPAVARRLDAMRQETDFGRDGVALERGRPGGGAWRRGFAPGSRDRAGPGGRGGVHRPCVRGHLDSGLAGLARECGGGTSIPLETVNHAFVGFWLPPGTHSVRLSYRPSSWPLGLAAAAAGLLAAVLMATTARRSS